MSGVPKIAIAESVERLKELMKLQKIALNYAKVQALYLLKIKAVETGRYLAVIVGRGRLRLVPQAGRRQQFMLGYSYIEKEV